MKKTLSAVAVALALAASASANATVIDLFTTDSPLTIDTTTVGGGVFTQVSSAAGDIIKGVGDTRGYRDTGVELKTSPNGDALNTSMVVTGGNLYFSTDSQAGATGLIRWDGSKAATSTADSDVAITGLGGVSLGDASLSSFILDIVFADAGFDFVLTAWTDATHWSSVLISSLAHSVPGTSYIPFIAFLDCTNSIPGPITTCGSDGAVDFSSVGALQAVIDPTGSFLSLDLTIDSVTTGIPEPGSLALAGLGLMALGGTRRRRNAKN